MYTILELINKSCDFLTKKGIESPRLNAELLLAHVLSCKRLDLYLSFDKPLGESEINLYREYIVRRSNFEPLQYIIGTVDFYGMNISINPDVLIPRPETEILVEKVLSSIPLNGNIAIALAANRTNVRVTAIDISEKALNIAKLNAVNNKIDNIEFLQSDVFELTENNSTLNPEYGNVKYDIIVSNPPYIDLCDYHSLQKEVLDFEPKIALTDNADGLSFYKQIIEISKKILTNKGKLFFEMGIDQSEKITDLMNSTFSNIEVFLDYQTIPRIIKGELNCEP